MNILERIRSWKKVESPSFLRHVPQAYLEISKSKSVDRLLAAGTQIYTLERHNSPNQYSDWYSNVLTMVHPEGKLAMPAAEVKTLSTEVTPIFVRANTVVNSLFTQY